MRSFSKGKMFVDVLQDNSQVTLSWRGESRERDPGVELTPFFDNVIKELDPKTVLIDVTQMEYINSSTVRPLIVLLRNLDAKRIDTTIVYDSSHDFQKIAFSAFKGMTFLLNYVSITDKNAL